MEKNTEVNKAANIGVNNNKEEMNMQNINNNEVNVNKAVDTGVNNKKEEIELFDRVNSEGLSIREVWDEMANEGKKLREEREMKNINNDGVNNVEREIELRLINNDVVEFDEDRVYDEDWEFTFLDYDDIYDLKVADDLDEDHYYYYMPYLTADDYEYYKDLDESYGILEDFKENPGRYVYDERYTTDEWKEEFETYSDEVYKKYIERFNDNESVIYMARSLERGYHEEYIIDILRKVVSARIWNDPYAVSAFPLTVKETPYGIYLIAEYVDIRESWALDSTNYTEYDMLRVIAELGDTLHGYYETEMVDGYEQREDFMKDGLQVIKLEDHQFVHESQLWETIGDERYTLPLINVIENVISCMVENEELDEVVIDHTDEIIKTLIKKGEFIYAVVDGELHEVEGVSSTGIKAVELYIPYPIELEKAADELWGFCQVVNNLDLWDREKDEMMMKVLSDDLYSFVHQYCREIWWDGGSN